MGVLDLVRGLLGGPRRPATRKALALKSISTEGTITPHRGDKRAVLRLPVEPLDGGADIATLTRLAAAINAGAGRTTLLAWGKPHTLARQLQDRQERVQRLPAGSGRHALAVSQSVHLAGLANGRPATADRPARPPVRRHGFYLVVEARTDEELHRLCLDLCGLYGAVRCSAQETAAIETEAWRGIPLPPRAVQLWADATDAENVELYVGPSGAHIRRVDPETGKKLEHLYP